jgi:hypothetical protein
MLIELRVMTRRITCNLLEPQFPISSRLEVAARAGLLTQHFSMFSTFWRREAVEPPGIIAYNIFSTFLFCF